MSGVTYRPATIDDAELAADLMVAAFPPFPQDPVITRYRWENPRAGYEYTRHLAYRDGRAIAYLGTIHAPWEEVADRHCEVEVWLDRAVQTESLRRAMYEWIDAVAVAQGAHILFTYCGEDEPEVLAALEHVGYEQARTERLWELDLAEHGPRLVREAAAARAQMLESGIRMLTVADWDDPGGLRQLFELNRRTVQDVPHTLTIVPESYDDFVNRTQSPDRRTDRWWIACDDRRAVAMSFLKFPPVRGNVLTGYTCSDRDYRGRGIARAVKLESLAQAVELGVPRVYTDNDAENAPMLHINQRLGYVRRSGFVEHHKRVRNSTDA